MKQAPVIEPITADAALEALIPDWSELWRRTPTATPFQSPAWLVPWWRSFHPGPLRAAAVRCEGRLVAFAGFYQDTSAAAGQRLLPFGTAISDYLDVLVEPRYEAEVGPLLLEYFVESAPGHALCCEELNAHAAVLRMWSHYRGAVATGGSACPVLALRTEGDVLNSSIPRAKLRKVRMARHRLQRRNGSIDAISPEATGTFLKELYRLHGSRWRSRGEPGVLDDDAVRRFHDAALPWLSEDGLASLYVVRIGGGIVGAYYGLYRDGHAYAYLGGFDPDFAYESPGTLLIAHAIEEAAREGARTFHFLRGREPYKYEWGAVDRWNQALEIRATQ